MTDEIFEGSIDRFKGITVNSESENCDISAFPAKIESNNELNQFLVYSVTKMFLDSLEKWREKGLRGVWFKVSLEQSDWVPVLAKVFKFEFLPPF